jgi:DmsE family decaheme c-type cytochrome
MGNIHSVSFLRFGAAAAAALLIGLLPGRSALAAESAAADPMANARIVGEKRCGECHDTERNLFGHTQHAKIFRENPRNETEKAVCEACHGPGSLHAVDTKDRTKIIGYSKEWGTPISKQTAQCLNCHSGGNRMHWEGSVHATKKLSCSDCHNPMARFSQDGLLKKASITETCQSCHPQQRSEFRKRSHMPVPEGKMTCEDCHNPHGSTTKRLLKADSVNELCYTCHAEKRGPMLWEHAPVRENCLNCHNAHGSNNEKLLAQARPMLCQNCHSGDSDMGGSLMAASMLARNSNPTATTTAAGIALGTQSHRLMGPSCQNCHMQIHGSNSPNGSRLQR